MNWNNLKVGDLVYIDNYKDGKFPNASPKISGPYTVHNLEYRKLRHMKCVFLYYPEDFLDNDQKYMETNGYSNNQPGIRA